MPHVQLATGSTHYELAGPATGRLVVLVHGGSLPMWTWDRQMAPLAAAGFRILRYDMLGRGESDIPAARFDRALYLRQLGELLDALAPGEKVAIAGVSFGAAIAAAFTAGHPARIRALALISPVVDYADGQPIVRIARLPFVGTLLLRLALPRAVARARALWAGAEDPARYDTLLQAQLARPAFVTSLLSMLRSDALEDYGEVYRELGALRIPSLVVWGSADGEIPRRHVERLCSLVPQADYRELDGADHAALFNDSERVNQALTGFLASVA